MVINLSVVKPFPFTPLSILSQTRVTFSFSFTDLMFSFLFPGGTSKVVFSFPIVMGTLVVLADFRSDFDDSVVKGFGGSNCVHLF